ncbi:MAG: Crp/Fnr family transcriptional regulator, partial [Acidobacteria bacterium]
MGRPSDRLPCGENPSCALCQRLSSLWAHLQELSLPVTYPARRCIFEQGETPAHLVVVCSGAVRLYGAHPGGRPMTFRVAQPGDLLGLAAVVTRQPYAFSADTIFPCCLRMVPQRAFLSALEAEPALWAEVAGEIARRHYDMAEQLKQPPRQRLIKLLLAFSVLVGSSKQGSPRHVVRLTNEELADLVGLSGRRVRQYLAELREQGVVVRHRGWLGIADRERLQG